MTDRQQCKCPVCGALGPEQFTLAAWRCKTCGLVDAPSQFKPCQTTEVDREKLISEPERTQQLFVDGAEYPIDETTKLTTHFPPEDVRQAAEIVEHYFYSQRNVREWCYGRLQSRDPDTHPNLAASGLTGVVINGGDVRMSDVRRLAAGFGCVVVPHTTPDREHRAAKAALAVIMDSDRFRHIKFDDLTEFNKERALQLVAAVRSELGFGL